MTKVILRCYVYILLPLVQRILYEITLQIMDVALKSKIETTAAAAAATTTTTTTTNQQQQQQQQRTLTPQFDALPLSHRVN